MWQIWIADTIGIIGAVLMLIAFYLLEAGKLNPDNKSYPLLNLFGAAFMLYSLFFQWNLSAVLMEAAWLLISLWGTIKAFRRESVLS